MKYFEHFLRYNMKEFDWTGIPDDLKKAMEGSLNSLYKTLEHLEKLSSEDVVLLELEGHGKTQIKRLIADTERDIQKTIDFFQI